MFNLLLYSEPSSIHLNTLILRTILCFLSKEREASPLEEVRWKKYKKIARCQFGQQEKITDMLDTWPVQLPSSSSPPSNIRMTCVLYLKLDPLVSYLHGGLQNPRSGMGRFGVSGTFWFVLLPSICWGNKFLLAITAGLKYTLSFQ